MLKAIIIADDNNVAQVLQGVLNECFKQEISFEALVISKGFITEIKRKRPDFILCINMAGFESVTFTDNIAYNLLGCKQIHLLFGKNIKNEKLLNNDLSIAMFFVTTDVEYMKSLREKYTTLPWITALNGWNGSYDIESITRNKEIMQECIKKILQECKLM